MAVGAGAVWVTSSDGTVSRIDPARNRVAATVKVEAFIRGVGVGPRALWVGGALSVSRIVPGSNRVVAIYVAANAMYVAVGPGGVWSANAEGTVSRIDPASNRVVANIKVGSPAGFKVRGIWVTDTPTSAASAAPPGPSPSGI